MWNREKQFNDLLEKVELTRDTGSKNQRLLEIFQYYPILQNVELSHTNIQLVFSC